MARVAPYCRMKVAPSAEGAPSDLWFTLAHNRPAIAPRGRFRCLVLSTRERRRQLRFYRVVRARVFKAIQPFQGRRLSEVRFQLEAAAYQASTAATERYAHLLPK